MIWVDNGNSWVIETTQAPDAAKVSSSYAKIAKLVDVVWDKVIYLSAGEEVVPVWESMPAEAARRLHEDIRRVIRGNVPGR